MSDHHPYASISEYYDVSIPGTRNRLRRYRPWFHVIAILAALGTIVALATSPRGNQIYLSQQVSPPHRFFENKCDQCHHASFHLIRRWLGDEEAKFEHACRTCHTTIGTADHHPESMTGSLPDDCSSCHQEHRGDQSLLVVHDRHCTRCHRQLESRGEPVFAEDIESFDTHPEFRVRSNAAPANDKHRVLRSASWNRETSRYQDKSRLKFNHQFHLSREGVPVPPSDSEYGANDGRVVLQCSNCHEPQVGGTMKPIVFEDHCQRCHQLNVAEDLLQPVPRGDVPTSKTPPFGLPHADVETIRALLRERLIASHVNRANTTPDARQYEQVEQRLREILALLFGTPPTRSNEPHAMAATTPVGIGQYCATCHEIESGANGNHGAQWRVKPPRIPDRWLQHARFSHESHETVRCQDCHYRDVPAQGLVSNHDSILNSTSATDILIPSIATCRVCHGAKDKHGSGADDRCVTCHQYHQHTVVNMPRDLREYLED